MPQALGVAPFRARVRPCQGSRFCAGRAQIPQGGAALQRPCLRRADPLNVRVATSGRIDMRPLLEVLIILLNIYWWVVILAVIVSWLIAFNVVNTRNQIVGMIADILYRCTEPVFRPIRNLLPNLGGIDISPLIVLLIIYVIERYIALYIYPNVF
jgi:YggT family protein